MNKYIPTEVQDLTDSKQRVMRNVVNEIKNNSRRPKHKWRYVLLLLVLTMSAMLFVLNEINIENEPQSATKVKLDVTKPTLSEEQGIFYLQGVTLGEPQSKVIERFGENYTIADHEDGSESDFILDYDSNARFYFYKDKLDSVLFNHVDENYFAQLFKDFDGYKLSSDGDRFIYLQETNQIIKAAYYSVRLKTSNCT